MHDTAKAIAAYENLTKVNPDDIDAQFKLASLYEDANNFDAAKKRLALVLAADPKNVNALLASGRVDIRAGDPQAALDPLNKALSLAIQFDNQEQKGAICAAMGIAYQDLNKLDDALRNYQQALEIRKKVGDQQGIASTLGQIAQVQDAQGDFNGRTRQLQRGDRRRPQDRRQDGIGPKPDEPGYALPRPWQVRRGP